MTTSAIVFVVSTTTMIVIATTQVAAQRARLQFFGPDLRFYIGFFCHGVTSAP